jgi:hypothetical protein
MSTAVSNQFSYNAKSGRAQYLCAEGSQMEDQEGDTRLILNWIRKKYLARV